MRNVNSAKNWHPSPKREPLKFMQDANVETNSILAGELGRHGGEGRCGVVQISGRISRQVRDVVRSVSCLFPVPAPVFGLSSAFWLAKL